MVMVWGCVGSRGAAPKCKFPSWESSCSKAAMQACRGLAGATLSSMATVRMGCGPWSSSSSLAEG